jgi:hypothetical protein
MRSIKKLTMMENKELHTEKRSRENSKDKSTMKPNHDIISQFKNTSFNLDSYDIEKSVLILDNMVNSFSSIQDRKDVDSLENVYGGGG